MIALLLLALAAGDTVLEAGQTLTLTEDLVLSGAATIDVRGTADQRCVILGNGHAIRSDGKWTGRLKITGCDIRGLGAPKVHAIDVKAEDHAEIALDRCTFDGSSSISLRNDGASEARVTNCVILENSTALVDKAREKSFPVFIARGTSAAAKLFQGNRVYKSHLEIEAPNWKIDDNILIGWRSGV